MPTETPIPEMSDLDAKAIVKAQNAKYEAFYKSKDVEGLAGLYTRTALIVPPDAPNATGRDAISAYLAPIVEQVGGLKLDTMDAVAIDAETIIEHTQMSVFAKDSSLLGTGKTMVLWHLEGGDWKMHWDIWNQGPW